MGPGVNSVAAKHLSSRDSKSSLQLQLVWLAKIQSFAEDEPCCDAINDRPYTKEFNIFDVKLTDKCFILKIDV